VVGGRDDARHKPGLTQTSLMVINFYCATYSISILPLFFRTCPFHLMRHLVFHVFKIYIVNKYSSHHYISYDILVKPNYFGSIYNNNKFK
jgi:hypothetical protein